MQRLMSRAVGRGERARSEGLHARALGVRYGSSIALEEVSVRLHPGERVALVGPNGAGKSSLLRALLGLVPHTGQVLLGDVAFVPQRQDIDLDFPITVAQVVAMGRRRLGRDRRAVARALARVGLDGLERRSLSTLSGGQAQRVFIARALAQEAGVLLLDEPLTGVDAATTQSLLELFARLAGDGAALLVSTHDLELVRRAFARCIALNRRIVGDGDPGDVLGPAGLERLFVHG
jgi:manganese/iron transport system ATP-binding protein